MKANFLCILLVMVCLQPSCKQRPKTDSTILAKQDAAFDPSKVSYLDCQTQEQLLQKLIWVEKQLNTHTYGYGKIIKQTMRAVRTILTDPDATTQNIYIIGPPGAAKTWFVNKLIKYLGIPAQRRDIHHYQVGEEVPRGFLKFYELGVEPEEAAKDLKKAFALIVTDEGEHIGVRDTTNPEKPLRPISSISMEDYIHSHIGAPPESDEQLMDEYRRKRERIIEQYDKVKLEFDKAVRSFREASSGDGTIEAPITNHVGQHVTIIKEALGELTDALNSGELSDQKSTLAKQKISEGVEQDLVLLQRKFTDETLADLTAAVQQRLSRVLVTVDKDHAILFKELTKVIRQMLNEYPPAADLYFSERQSIMEKAKVSAGSDTAAAISGAEVQKTVELETRAFRIAKDLMINPNLATKALESIAKNLTSGDRKAVKVLHIILANAGFYNEIRSRASPQENPDARAEACKTVVQENRLDPYVIKPEIQAQLTRMLGEDQYGAIISRVQDIIVMPFWDMKQWTEFAEFLLLIKMGELKQRLKDVDMHDIEITWDSSVVKRMLLDASVAQEDRRRFELELKGYITELLHDIYQELLPLREAHGWFKQGTKTPLNLEGYYDSGAREWAIRALPGNHPAEKIFAAKIDPSDPKSMSQASRPDVARRPDPRNYDYHEIKTVPLAEIHERLPRKRAAAFVTGLLAHGQLPKIGIQEYEVSGKPHFIPSIEYDTGRSGLAVIPNYEIANFLVSLSELAAIVKSGAGISDPDYNRAFRDCVVVFQSMVYNLDEGMRQREVSPSTFIKQLMEGAAYKSDDVVYGAEPVPQVDSEGKRISKKKMVDNRPRQHIIPWFYAELERFYEKQEQFKNTPEGAEKKAAPNPGPHVAEMAERLRDFLWLNAPLIESLETTFRKHNRKKPKLEALKKEIGKNLFDYVYVKLGYKQIGFMSRRAQKKYIAELSDKFHGIPAVGFQNACYRLSNKFYKPVLWSKYLWNTVFYGGLVALPLGLTAYVIYDWLEDSGVISNQHPLRIRGER